MRVVSRFPRQAWSRRGGDSALPLSAVVAAVVLSGIVFLLLWAAAIVVLKYGSQLRGDLFLILALVSLVGTLAAFLGVLRSREQAFPLCEVGSVCAIVTTLYFAVPILNFIAGGMKFTFLSDSRLFVANPTSLEVAAVSWRSVVYLMSFGVAYLVVRGGASAASVRIRNPGAEKTVVLVLTLLALGVLVASIEMLYGVSFDPSYENLRAGVGLVTQLPYEMQQVMHNVRGMFFLAKQGVLFLLLLHWKRPVLRYFAIAWLLLEVVSTVVRQGARTEAVLLLLTAALLYHRVVRPLAFVRVCVGGAILLVGIVLFGFVRDIQGGLSGGLAADVSVLAMMNEFQSLFATTFDLWQRRNALGELPWTLYMSEILMLIPGQLLPFRKIDPSLWYLEQLGLQDSQVGFMFGVLSQAILGVDWLELMVRGTVLGCVLGLIHRWYVKRSQRFEVTLLYVFLCVWSYYTVRAATFYFVYPVVYRFLPFLFIVWFGEAILRGALRNHEAGGEYSTHPALHS